MNRLAAALDFVRSAAARVAARFAALDWRLALGLASAAFILGLALSRGK